VIADLFEVHVSVPELMLRGTLVYWLLDMLSYRFAAVRRFASPGRLTLVRSGVAQRRNMRREFITMEELNEKLREQGIEKLADVRAAYLEGDGQISVIRNSQSTDRKRSRSLPGA
jgi:uncharacterized membrane protein YcaP (DUF421 family)